ncbi:ABC transporter permease [Calditrichota bacterium]
MAKKRQLYTVDEAGALKVICSLDRGGPPKLLDDLILAAERSADQNIKLDLSAVERMDSLGASVLAELAVRVRTKGKQIEFIGVKGQVEAGMSRYYFPSPEVKLPVPPRERMAALGTWVYQGWEAAGELLILISETVYWSITALWRADGHRRGAVEAQALTIGVGAMPVVLLIAFLVGLILALQSAAQLRQFGANIYVADLVAISMTREMGPLMTAILLAGRSGAAIAAEIAAMTVSEEIDALKVMGLNPVRYVVVPKVWGILITGPLLAVMATVVGIAGGFVVAISALDLSPQAYILEVADALYFLDILSGFVKSIVFAVLIVILAAFYGFRVQGGPVGVGRATTSSVVAAIFAVIVADSLLGLLFYL